MRTPLVALAALIACSGPSKPRPGEPGGDSGDGGGGGKARPTPITVKRLYIAQGRPSGTIDTTTEGDAVTIKVVIVQNGRGPKVTAKLRLAPDGTIATLSATGTHTMGTKVDESFSLEGRAATWKSEEEQGEREVDGAAFYLPLADVVGVQGLLVRAAVANGGTLPLLPDGEVRVEKVAEVELSANGQTRTVHGYSVVGIDLIPDLTWMNPDGTWFGFATDWDAALPEGWESAADTLAAKRRELERARDHDLAVAQAKRPPEAGVAYTHARVLDVQKGKWLADQTVVVVGDKIAAVGKKVKIPKGAEVVDLAGKAIVPGLIDMHAHHGGADGVLNIASGVTTVRDVGNDPDKLDESVQRYDDGTAIGPRVVRYGFIEGRGEKAAASKVTATDEAEAKAAVEFFAARGYAGIKIYNSIEPELVPVLAKLAHDRKMKVIGHIPAFMLAHEAVRAGYDGIEHINMLFLNFLATKETDTRDTTRFKLVGEGAAGLDLASQPVKDFIALLKEHDTLIDPTLSAFEGLLTGVPGQIVPGLEPLVARLPIQVRRQYLRFGLPLTAEQHETYLASYDKLLAMVKLLHDSGIRVVLGTDDLAGLAFHHEMALFARAGFSNATVLRLATIDAARALGLDKQIGTIAKGKLADFAIVDGDPLADLASIGAVVATLRGGVRYESAPLYASAGVQPYAK
jgi:imidazolonepropionase-like amidohydrolase